MILSISIWYRKSWLTSKTHTKSFLLMWMHHLVTKLPQGPWIATIREMGNCMATPLWFMILLVLCGYALTIGHHFYFSSLDKIAAGSPLRRQGPISFGAIFTQAAMGAIYDQHSLTLFKRDSFSLFKVDSFPFNGLDYFFALKSTPTGFFIVELLAHAKLVVLLALYSWWVMPSSNKLNHDYCLILRTGW